MPVLGIIGRLPTSTKDDDLEAPKNYADYTNCNSLAKELDANAQP